MSKDKKNDVKEDEKEAVQSKEEVSSAADSSVDAEKTAENAAGVTDSQSTDSQSADVKKDVTDSDKIKLLEEKVEELSKANADLKDQLLRKAADFDNYRKRTNVEKQEAYDYANTSLLKDLLESLDNFDRTVEAAASATDPKTIADGVTMINKSMVSMLENKYNLVSYGAVGDAFDPDIHEAIGKSDDPVASPVLKAVYLKGYKLKDRVIRHAKVMVSMPDGSVKEEARDSNASSKEQNEASDAASQAQNK